MIGQLALVAVIPLLTRFIEPGELGLFHIAFAICILLQPAASLRIEFALPSIRSEYEYRRLLRLAWTILVLTTASLLSIAGLILLLGSTTVANMVFVPAILIIAYAGMNIDNATLIRTESLGRLSVRNILAGVFAALFQIGSVFLYPTAIGLALAIFLGRFSALMLTRQKSLSKSQDAAFLEQVKPEWTVRRGVTAVMTSIASAGALQSLIIYSALLAGSAAAAQVGVAQRSASAPLGLLSQGLSQAMQSGVAASIRKHDPSVPGRIHAQMRSLLPLAVIVTVSLIIGGPLLAEPIFGPEWRPAGLIIAILAVPSGLQLLLAPATVVFYMIGSERILLQLQIGWLVMASSLTVSLHLLTGEFLWGVTGFSIASAIYYVLAYVTLRIRVRMFCATAPTL